MLVKDGFNSMAAIVLLESEDFSPKMPHGQQKLLLKALQVLRPGTTEAATDLEAKVAWAATPIEACITNDNIGAISCRFQKKSRS